MAVYALGDVEPSIDPDAYVHPDATVIGGVTLGPGTSVWPRAVLRADYGVIRIGARTSVQDGAVIHTTEAYPTVIGDDVVIGHLAHLESCTVHDSTLIGTGSIVLHRAVVESGAVVGAGAVVTNDMVVPARALALGVPAKLRLDAADAAEMVRGAASYVANAQRFRRELRRLD